MSYSKVKIPSEVYHLTKRKNAEQILKDGNVMRFGDSECWFCRSVPDLLRYMEYTVLCECKPYIDTDGSVKRYPPFVPEEYCVLKLTPRYREGNWYQWNQEIPPEPISKYRLPSTNGASRRKTPHFRNYRKALLSDAKAKAAVLLPLWMTRMFAV